MGDVKNVLMGMVLSGVVGLLISVVVSFFARTFPREKAYEEKIGPAVGIIAKSLSRFLRNRVGPESERKIEEGIICTILYWVRRAGEDFECQMKADNLDVIKRVIEKSEVLRATERE
jgi:hypothetical protein